MYNSLTGEITYKAPGTLFLLLSGVEWELSVSDSTLNCLPVLGQSARVFTYLYHKEDRMKLYGFHSTNERSLFLDLLKVDSIGPALALKILSGIKAEDFLSALEAENVSALTVVPGLGKKTAEKIIFKLRGKLSSQEDGGDPLIDEIAAALAGMGFDAKKAKLAVAEAAKALSGSGLAREAMEAELLKRGINLLSKGK